MTRPLVTVVIPNYNYARYLGQAVDSALAQTYDNREVVVVDNSSTDGSLDVLRGYGDRVRWFQQENLGQSGSRNRGIQESRGELVAFLDADDVWLPDKLVRQVALFSDPDTGLVYSGYTITDGALNPVEEVAASKRGRLLRAMALSAGGATVIAGESTAVVRREVFDRVGLFDLDLSFSSGWDMWRRIACHFAIEVVEDPLTLYRQHSSNLHRNIELLERDKLKAIEKMFADPDAAPVHGLWRRSYGAAHLMLSGSYLQVGRWPKAFSHATRAALIWPPSVAYVAAYPLRHLRRRRGELGATR